MKLTMILIILVGCARLPSDYDPEPKIPDPGNNINTDHFFTNLTDQSILESIDCAEKVVQSDDFLTAVSKTEKFSSFDGSGDDVVKSIKYRQGSSEVKYYKSRIPWSAVLAYTNDSKSIYVNTRRMDRSIASIAGTLVHEMTHNIGYSHSSANDLMSVPYLIGDLAEQVAHNICEIRKGFQ